MAKILRLAIALIEPGENAQDLGRTLRRERRINLGELRHVERLVGHGTGAHIAADQIELQGLRHVYAGILKQGGKVVSRRSEQGILKIDQPKTSDAAALRQPDQVG